MTYPITPNPAIHAQPANIGKQQMLFTAGQLEAWAQELPLAMTLDLIDAILRAFGASQAEIDTINKDYTTIYDGVESWLTLSNANTQAFFNNISASLQQSWLTLQNFFNGLAQQTDADVTAALAWLQGQFNQLQALLQQSWLSFQNLLNGIVQQTDADVAAAVAWLQNVGVAANNALTQIEDFLTTGDWADLTTAWNDLMQGIFGSSTSLGLVGSIPAPAVVNTVQNLQPVWDFPDSASVSASGQWSWDGTHDHTGVAGSGSAKYVCNGTLGALRGIPGAVQPSQVVTPSAWVMWSGVTAAGGTSPFQLELIPYSGAGSSLFPGTPVTVASVTSPSSSHAWTELTGTYTVPSSGVTAVQLRLVVTADATAGTVNWDDCQADVSGGFLADMQADTNNIIDSFAPGGTSGQFVTGVENLLALVGLTPASVGGATNLTALWTTIVNDFINPLNALEISAVNGLASSLSALLGTTTFQNLLDSVANALGHSGTGHTIANIETYLGLIPPTNVTPVLGGSSLGADVQAILDYIANALGHTGTGHTLTQIETYLGLIPATNVTNVLGQSSLAADVQAILDYIANALGHSGTGHTLTQIESYLGLIPASNVTNVLGGSNLGADVSAVSSTATSASTTASIATTNVTNTWSWLFGTTTPTGSTPVQSTKVANVLGGSSLGADVQAILDYIANALGHSGTGHTLTQIETYLGLIPSGNVTNVLGGSDLGHDLTNISNWLFGTTTPASTSQVQAGTVPAVGGAPNLLAAVQAGWDQLVQALTPGGSTATNTSLGQLANAASANTNLTNSALSAAQSAAMLQAQQATAKPGYMAIDSTMDAVFPLSHMIASPTYNTITSAASTIGFIRTSDNISKLSVAFLGSKSGTVSTAVINVYSMNTTTGVVTQVISGSNITSSIGTGLGWVYYTLPSALAAAPGNVYAVQLAITGSGSISLMGLSNSTFPQNSAVYPAALGASAITSVGTAPTHDATGAGSFTATSATSFNWTHVIGATANAILIEFFTTASVSSVRVGGVSATLLGSTVISSPYTVYVYRLVNPPTGSQPVQVNLSSSSNLVGNSDSYIGVASFGTVATNSSTSSTSASLSVSSGSGQTAVTAMFSVANHGFSAFNQTSRWNSGNATATFYGVAGDAAGASTVSFTATSPGTAWGAVGVSLVGVATYTPTYSTTVPWFGLGTSALSAPVAQAPVTTEYSTRGTYTYTFPSWFNLGVDFLDVIALGPGGGGGAGFPNPGSAGTSTTVTVGTTTVTAAAGTGGPSGNTTFTGAVGASPGNETYNSVTYYGGGQSSYGYGIVTVGSSPGGGGAGGGTGGSYGNGGNAGSWAAQTFNPSGSTVSVTVGAGGAASPFYGAEAGADGAVWLVARQA